MYLNTLKSVVYGDIHVRVPLHKACSFKRKHSVTSVVVMLQIDELECELCRKEQEVKDRDEINEFLRNEIRMSDMKMKVK